MSEGYLFLVFFHSFDWLATLIDILENIYKKDF